jgi:hypothetical protein
MELTEAQKDTVRQWVEEGAGLADVQKRLADELQISMTYMDVRFLVIDLGAKVQDRPERVAPTLGDTAQPGTGAAASPAMGAAPDDMSAGGVKVDVDVVTKPGTIVSGTVVFTDGEQAAWSLDQFGRLALAASTPDYRPSEQDLQSFQQELKAALQKRGF